MNNPDYLPVRFQLGGEFVHHGETLDFIGGDEAWSYIERKKVSVCEIVSNLKRHMIITDKDSVFLHWLFPGKELINGLRPLNDDKECSYMLECTTDGAVADVYAEVVHENSEEDDDSDSEYQVEEEEESGSEGDDDAISVPIAISNPSKDLERYISFSDWEGDDLENSEEDEVAKQYRRNAKMVKKGIKGREDICEALVKATHGEGWVVISDQQKGLLNAIGELLPHAEHRMCTRHIYANWRKKYRDQKFQKPFWSCAKASNREMFNYCKALLAQKTPEGAKAVMNTEPIHWSRAWFTIGSNCDSVDNNMCESFNNWIVAIRALPIITMLEGLRCKTYVRIQENRFKSEKWLGRICPNIVKKLNKYIEYSGKCLSI